MSYFNPVRETEVIVDASSVGLGGLLAQDNKVISYATRALSDVESRYSQTGGVIAFRFNSRSQKQMFL